VQLDERTDRLLGSVRRGWSRVCREEELRARALRWLEEHPAGWPSVQEVWLEALRGRGELRAWLDDGARPDEWSGEIPLHSVLTSHPFACLPRWSTPHKSNGS